MDQQRDRTRKEGGLLPLAALSAALLIGGLGAAIPKHASGSFAMPVADGGGRAPETRISHGPGTRARHPALLPSADTDPARARLAGGRE